MVCDPMLADIRGNQPDAAGMTWRFTITSSIASSERAGLFIPSLAKACWPSV
jgi:hypothetical protein